MTISIWRYCHFILALFSSFFLIIISVTGLLLSFEPILDKNQPYFISNSSSIKLSEVITNVKRENDEVLSLKKNKNNFVIIETEEGRFYINPFTGKRIGKYKDKSNFFKFLTNLHRSFFLKSYGRAFVGVISFLLFFIIFSGIFLIIKRQNGFKRFFSSIVKDTSSQYYHVIFGRIAFIPLVVLAITGTYLSLKRFKIIPTKQINLKIDIDSLKETQNKGYKNFDIFKKTTLKDLREIDFPLFEDVEEFYHLKLKKRELYINQFNGKIESEQYYPFTVFINRLSFNLHTGKGSIIWSLILGFSMIFIPYFIYSGLIITFGRIRGKIKNIYKKDESEIIILVGSENGSTSFFAKMLHQGLTKLGKKSFITYLNNFCVFKKMDHLIVLTSTYGKGKAPVNASKFIDLYKRTKIKKPFNYSVVGFGSLSYPDFCKYAFDVDFCINFKKISTKELDVHTVNNRSFESFSTWVRQWGEKTGFKVKLPKNDVFIKRKKTMSFKVINKTIAKNNPDENFLIELKPQKKQSFISGDLLAIYPKNDNQERLYSLAVLNKTILLSVKRHKNGICSNYLNNLKNEDCIQGYIIKNKEFYFPKKTCSVIMIATGTGIGPFLGMIENNYKKQNVYLYWGAKNKESFNIYKNIIDKGIDQNRLTKFIPAYSRETDKKIYVQDLIKRDREIVIKILKNNGVIMICGSIDMQKDIMKILNKYILIKINKPISYFKNKKQIKIDCY